MERYQIRYFLAVVDLGNFSRAASQCNVSQPTLSVGIAKLESALGAKLLFRTSQRVQLTEAGNRFLPYARRIEREYHITLQAMRGTPQRTLLRIGVLSTIPGLAVADAYAACGNDSDQLYELVFGTERELQGHLTRGRLDVALTILRESNSRFRQHRIFEEGYTLVLSAHHRLAGFPQLDANDLQNEAMIVRRQCEALSETSRFFVERGVRPHFALRSTNDERILQMVAAGVGLTVMPECYNYAGVVSARLAGFNVRRAIGFQYANGSEHLSVDGPPLLRSIEATLASLVA